MNDKYQPLIDRLSSDIGDHQQRRLPANQLIFFSLVIYIVVVTIFMGWLAPFRESFPSQLVISPRFVFETILGVLSCLLLAYCAIKSSVPAGLSRLMIVLTCAVTLVWVGHISFGLVIPIFEPSMAGKREQCYLEALYYSVSGSIAFNIMILRRYSMNSLFSGLLSGAATGFIIALMMQLACMHDAYHGLTHHIFPAIAVTITSGVALYFVAAYRRRRMQHNASCSIKLR